MSNVSSVLTIIEKILTLAGPLIVELVGKGDKATAEKVMSAVATAIALGQNGLDQLDEFADDLKEIHDEVAALSTTGGPGEAEFDATAARIESKTARLRAVVEARG